MPEIVINLHMHTTYSDGSGTHADIANAAIKAGLDAVIITDHNVKDTFDITDRVYIIQKGKLLSSGHPTKVVKEEHTRKLFLGSDFQWQEM